MKSLLFCGICLLAAPAALAQSMAPGWLTAPARAHSSPTPQSIHPAVARIVAPGEGSVSYGSGTLIYVNDSAGLVVTNWHVINEATGPISVHFPDGFYSLGTVQRVDRDWDLAAIAIRKPNAQPVTLASEAPRPGEILTIAGYGSGSYRAVSGRCTQYVAPGTTFPYEMVELAASARQGDSGGPIFNNRGELAGVLFGEGHGRTSGSYCGRVRWFLSTVAPITNPLEDPPMVAVTGSGAAKAPTGNPAAQEPHPEGYQFARSAPPTTNSQGWHTANADPRTKAGGGAMPVVASTRSADPGLGDVQYLGWEDIAGETWSEQAKTILATIGAGAVLLRVLRFMTAERAKA